jgi:flagellar protein FlaG
MSQTPQQQQSQQPKLNVVQSPDYRETYANSVQVRMSVWDIQLTFGVASSETPEELTIRNHQAVFLSPQQAKALWNVLGQNLAQYEAAFGQLNLEPKGVAFPQGPIN